MKNNGIVFEFISLMLSIEPEVYEGAKIVILAVERDPHMTAWFKGVFEEVEKCRPKLITMEHSC